MTDFGTCQYLHLAVDDMELDIQNPRIAKYLEMYSDDPTAEQIALALGAESSHGEERGPSFYTLKQSIKTNQGIIHPIIVNSTALSELVVIEGNTRVLIYREFREDNIPGNWETIPAIVYEDLDDATIDAIRLQTHLVGVRQWDPYSKAKYLHSLSTNDNLTLDQIVAFCGGDRREVQTFINAFNDMEKYYANVIGSDPFDASRFSAFVELQSQRVINSLINHGFSKEQFAQWVHKRKLFPLNTVRRLPQILENERPRGIFLSSNAQEAIRVLDAIDPASGLGEATLVDLAKELCNRINRIPFERFQEFKNHPEREEVEALQDLKETISLFCQDIKSESL